VDKSTSAAAACVTLADLIHSAISSMSCCFSRIDSSISPVGMRQQTLCLFWRESKINEDVAAGFGAMPRLDIHLHFDIFLSANNAE
jgi:hypothetical protein